MEQMFLGQKKDPRFHSPNINLMYEVVRHEIGHVLGIGTRWHELVNDGTFVGGKAVEAFLRLGGQGAGVPLEGDHGHWSEDEMGVELMTPGIRGDASYSPVSAITLGALADIGWAVDMSVAEEYVVGQRSAYGIGQGDTCIIALHGTARGLGPDLRCWSEALGIIREKF